MHYFIIAHNLNLLTKYNIPQQHQSVLLVGDYKDKHINIDTIVCKKLLDNIENFPYLCSYTGWYSVSKNKLYKAHNVVSLLEYDIMTSQELHNFNLKTTNEQTNNNYIIAYSKTLTDHYVFYKSTPWLEISLKKVYNIDLIDFVNSYKDQYPFWPTTTNITMSTILLSSFVDWFNPLCEIFKHHPLGSYVHERALFVYCVLHNTKIIYAPDKLITHNQSQSHNIQDIYGKTLSIYNKSYLTPDMIPSYDTIYDQATIDCVNTL